MPYQNQQRKMLDSEERAIDGMLLISAVIPKPTVYEPCLDKSCRRPNTEICCHRRCGRPGAGE